MATEGEPEIGNEATGRDTARQERDSSPSMAELVQDAIIYTHYDDSDQMYGYFSPRLALANMGVEEYMYSDYSGGLESDPEYELAPGSDSCDESPPWEGGGYDYQFVCEVPDTLQCLICATAAREPQQVDCCGKVFCRVCIKKLKKRAQNKACPNCREKKWKSFFDKKSKLAVLSVK